MKEFWERILFNGTGISWVWRELKNSIRGGEKKKYIIKGSFIHENYIDIDIVINSLTTDNAVALWCRLKIPGRDPNRMA